MFGGVEGLFCSIMGNVNQGDEVCQFDPSYDCYRPQVQMAGGKVIGIPLKPKMTVSLSLYSILVSICWRDSQVKRFLPTTRISGK